MKSFKNCWSITRSYFKFVLAAFILSGVATTNAATYEQPLNELKHHDYTYFNNVLGSSNLPFYVSPRWNIDSAKMVIEYEKTAKLKDENITFSPEFRGKKIPYIREDNKLVLDLPIKNFAKGENEVLLSVQIKAPAKNCNLGEEQVILDLKKSYVVMDYQPLPINKKQNLAFSDVFDKYEHTPIKLNMVVENLNLAKLSQVTNFASALAVGVKNREIDLKLGAKALDGYDNIYLPEAKNMADKAFVQNNVLITDFTKIPLSEQNILKQDHIYTFKELGFANYMFKRSKEQKAFVFKIPSQTYLAPNQYVELELDLVSGNYLKEGSKLDVFVNDEKVSEIRLKNTEGQKIEKYKVSFRASLLKKGENKILFFADIKAQDAETNCLENKNEGVFVTLFNNSTLKIPPLGLLVELPNMKYIFNDAYPFATPRDIYVEKLTNQSAEAVASFNAYLAQKSGNPSQKLTFDTGKPDYAGKNIIFFAEDKSLPDNILKISQKFVGKRHLQITLLAKDYAQMNNGLSVLWQKGGMENLNGDTLEIDTDNQKIIAYNTAEHKEINSDVGIDDNLSFLSNNNRVLFNILIFVFLFATAGWLYIILKGLDNENK